MDPKLTIFFCLIGTIIGLSHFNGEEPSKLKWQLDRTSEYLQVDNHTMAEAPQVASLPVNAAIKADRGQTDPG